MTHHPPPTPGFDQPPPSSSDGYLQLALFDGVLGDLAPGLPLLITLALGLVAAAGFFATLRFALEHRHQDRVLAGSDPERHPRLVRALARADRLSVMAGLAKVLCDLAYVAAVATIATEVASEGATLGALGVAFALAAPLLLLVTEALPSAIARERGDRLLRNVLPVFYVVQLPFAWIGLTVDVVRRALLRVLKLRDGSSSARKLVEDLREVIEDASIDDLDSTEREIIENVMEFRDVDVEAVMTPRTEIHAVDVEEGVEKALEVLAESGHSRVPVYDGSVDSIIGTVTALQLTRLLAAGEDLAKIDLRDVLTPPFLVPETKSIADLLVEFRRSRHKIAVVVDEYGGTAGMVTVHDVLEELVGDLADEHEASPPPVREVEAGLFEVEAGVHVTDVNETLGLTLPEEADFETLGGFVLSELGRFPKEGESFEHDGTRFGILEASDRRILKVLVRRGA